MLTQADFPFVPFVIPPSWLSKTQIVMPPEDKRVVTLGEYYDHTHGCTIERTFHITTPCCEWTGWNNGEGHGKVSVKGQTHYVHRLSWTFANELVLADDNVVDHLCRNRPCWNPTHLERVTVAVNTARGAGRFYQYKRQHEYGE